MKHHVVIRLLRTRVGTPYKWRGICICGWTCLSWQWSRPWLAAYDPSWDAEGMDATGGALPMALDHIAEKQAAYAASFTHWKKVSHG